MANSPYPNALKDVLYNCHQDELRTPNEVHYARGIIVGVVSTLCFYMPFTDALRMAKENMPPHYQTSILPESWRPEWEAIRIGPTPDFREAILPPSRRNQGGKL